MSRTVPIEDAKFHLRQLIESLDPNDELTIVENGEPIAKVRREQRKTWPCQPGTARDMSHWMAPDFDSPLDDFREYME
jgi:antitoxin (DNA-binding transcriptional repressor) of toxin-antitoxin stability system